MMSQPCVIETCKRTSRAICHCCNKNVCLDHLKEHNDLINCQLNPLVDEINELGDHLLKVTLEKLINDNHEKLDQWRDDSYKKINSLYKQKYHEINQYCLKKIDKSRKEIDEIRLKLVKLVRDEEATHEVIQSLTLTMKDIKQKLKDIEEKGIEINLHSLSLDDNLMNMEESISKKFDLSILSSSYHTIHSSNRTAWALASNKQCLLIDQYPSLYLLDRDLTVIHKSTWKFDPIVDMCWSETLKNFIIVTNKKKVYLVNEDITSIEHIRIIKEQNWWSLTCSKTSLFLSLNESNTNIFEFNLSFQLIKQWKPPYSCQENEFIYHIEYNNETLALIITHSVNRTVHLVLRSSTTFHLLWSIQLDLNYKWFKTAVRSCSLKDNEWIVVEEYTSSVFHIGKDGKMIAKRGYNTQPWNAIVFNSSLLAIRTETSVNIHRL